MLDIQTLKMRVFGLVQVGLQQNLSRGVAVSLMGEEVKIVQCHIQETE